MRRTGPFQPAFLWDAESISEKLSTWECCACSLPVLSFFCAPHTSSSSSQRSYRKDYFLSMPSSSSYYFFWPQQNSTHLPTERMWPFDNRVIQQFVLLWSCFPPLPLGFFLSLFATNGKICYAWNAKFWLPHTALSCPVKQQVPETLFQPGAFLFKGTSQTFFEGL